MERFWNLIYYFVFKADYKLHLLFNKINPFLISFRPSYKRRNIKIKKEINSAFKNFNNGISVFRAGVIMFFLIILLCYGISFLLIGILKIVHFNSYVFIIIIPITITFNYLLLFKKNKYVSYFKEFEKMKHKEKIKWAWISFVVVIGFFFIALVSFIYMNYQI